MLFVIRGFNIATEIAPSFSKSPETCVFRYETIASRILCESTKAVLYCASRSRANCGGMPLRTVHKKRNRRENVTDSEVTAGEDRAARNRELPAAVFAAPHLPAGRL
jgi:hypothetical protein